MNKTILTILFTAILALPVSAVETWRAASLLLNNGTLHGEELDNIARITFSADDLIIKTTTGDETPFALNDIAKITFGEMIHTALPPLVETGRAPSLQPATITNYYTITGQRLSKEPERGFYIIRYDDGTVKKVMK